MEKPKPSEEVVDGLKGGVFVTVFFVTTVILLLLLWSPVSHYLGKWNNYWNDKNDEYKPNISSYSDEKVEDEKRLKNEIKWKKYDIAVADCEKRAEKKFNSRIVSSYATSTSFSDGKSTYETYDCYGIPYQKLNK